MQRRLAGVQGRRMLHVLSQFNLLGTLYLCCSPLCLSLHAHLFHSACALQHAFGKNSNIHLQIHHSTALSPPWTRTNIRIMNETPRIRGRDSIEVSTDSAELHQTIVRLARENTRLENTIERLHVNAAQAAEGHAKEMETPRQEAQDLVKQYQ